MAFHTKFEQYQHWNWEIAFMLLYIMLLGQVQVKVSSALAHLEIYQVTSHCKESSTASRTKIGSNLFAYPIYIRRQWIGLASNGVTFHMRSHLQIVYIFNKVTFRTKISPHLYHWLSYRDQWFTKPFLDLSCHHAGFRGESESNDTLLILLKF